MHPPAAVAAFDELDEARLVAAVRVVVAGEKIAVFIKRQFLRIAHADGENLEVRAVGIAAHDGAGVARFPLFAFLALHVHAAITDGEIHLSIRPEAQPVHVVAAKCELHAEAREQFVLRIRLAVAVAIGEAPEARDVRPPHLVAASEDARRRSVECFSEAIGENRGFIRAPGALRVFEQDDAFLLRLERRLEPLRLGVKFVHHREAILDGAGGDVVIEPVHVGAIIQHTAEQDSATFTAAFLPVALAHIPASLFIRRKGDRIGELRFIGPKLHLHSCIVAERFDGVVPVLCTCLHFAIAMTSGLACGKNTAGEDMKTRDCRDEGAVH